MTVSPEPSPAPAPPAPKKSLLSRARALFPLGKFIWKNRKAEVALALAVASLVREAVQAATGH